MSPWLCPFCGKRKVLHWRWVEKARPTPCLIPVPREWFGCRYAFTRMTDTLARYGKLPEDEVSELAKM